MSRISAAKVTIATGAVVTAMVVVGTAFAAPWRQYISKRFDYSMRYPPGWIVRPATRTPTNGVPSYYESSMDRYTLPPGKRTGTVGLHVNVSSQRVKHGTPTRVWIGADENSIADNFGCVPDARGAVTVGGAPARLLTYRACPSGENYYFLVIGLVHQNRGYRIYWLGRRGHEAQDRALFLQFVKTFR